MEERKNEERRKRVMRVVANGSRHSKRMDRKKEEKIRMKRRGKRRKIEERAREREGERERERDRGFESLSTHEKKFKGSKIPSHELGMIKRTRNEKRRKSTKERAVKKK